MFQFNKLCKVIHINVRRNHHEDAPVTVDIKFEVGDVTCKQASGVLGAESPQEVEAAFFSKNGEKRFPGVVTIPIPFGFENKHEITIGDAKAMRVAKLFKVTIQPRGKGLFDCTFTVTIDSPPKAYMDAVAAHLHEMVKVKLSQDAGLFDPAEPPLPDTVSLGVEPEQSRTVN